MVIIMTRDFFFGRRIALILCLDFGTLFTYAKFLE